MTTLPFLLLTLSAFVIFDSDNPFRVRSVSQRPDNVLLTRMTTLPFLLLALSPFMSDSDYPLILCLLCKSKTLWNIFLILGRNVEQDQMTCHVQE